MVWLFHVTKAVHVAICYEQIIITFDLFCRDLSQTTGNMQTSPSADNQLIYSPNHTEDQLIMTLPGGEMERQHGADGAGFPAISTTTLPTIIPPSNESVTAFAWGPLEVAAKFYIEGVGILTIGSIGLFINVFALYILFRKQVYKLDILQIVLVLCR